MAPTNRNRVLRASPEDDPRIRAGFLILLQHRCGQAARLSGVVAAMTPRPTPLTRLGGKLDVDPKQKTKKVGIMQYGVAHLGGLLAW